MYAIVCIISNIDHIFGVGSRFLENPIKEHYKAIKMDTQYLRGTIGDTLCFGGSNPIYIDVDITGDLDKRNFTRYLFTFLGGLIS